MLSFDLPIINIITHGYEIILANMTTGVVTEMEMMIPFKCVDIKSQLMYK